MTKSYSKVVIDPITKESIIIDVDASDIIVGETQTKLALIYTRKIQPYLKEIMKWRQQGKGIATICKILDISTDSFFKYRTEYKEFRNAYEIGTDLLADNLETALFKEAVGYDYYEETLSKAGDVVSVKKVARPSISASKFALTNIRPKNWKNKVDSVHSTKLSGANLEAIGELDVNELKKLVALAKQKEIE